LSFAGLGFGIFFQQHRYALSPLGFILISTVTVIVSTFDDLQVDEDGNQAFPEIILAILDLVTLVNSLLPFFISMILEEVEDFQNIGKAGKIIRLLKVMRILRVYKLFRNFTGLQSLLYTIQQAYNALGWLMFIVGKNNKRQYNTISGIGILTFSSLYL
jgi:hypothetical protein